MRHQRKRLWLRLSLAGCVLSGFVLGACARASTAGIAAAISPTSTTPQGTLVAPVSQYTVYRDNTMWRFTSGNCSTATPPRDGALAAHDAFVGQQSWGSGGASGYECQTTVRTFMAGVSFTPEQLGAVEPAVATLQLHVDPFTQPNDCVVQIEIATSNWLTEDPAQGLASPYATIPLGTTPTRPPPTSVKFDRQAHLVWVDVTSAAQGWIVKRPPAIGLVFKSPYDCGVIHLTQIALFLDHTVVSA
jgi:hypothetical protein